MIVASDWRALGRNSLRGFVTLKLSPSGIVLRDCSLDEKDGRRWVGLPAMPLLDAEGRHRIGEDSKRLYTPAVEIIGKSERERFQRTALAAVDKLFSGGDAP
jgi:hypothetical protein